MENHSQERLEELLLQFAATPERLARAVAGKTPEQLEQLPRPDEWGTSAILAHLRASDDIVSPRIYMLLARDNPPLAAFDERRWAEIAGYAMTAVPQSLALFTLRRAEVVAVLRQFPVESWQRSGQHEVRGTVSVLAIVQDIVAHEAEHCAQLEALFTS